MPLDCGAVGSFQRCLFLACGTVGSLQGCLLLFGSEKRQFSEAAFGPDRSFASEATVGPDRSLGGREVLVDGASSGAILGRVLYRKGTIIAMLMRKFSELVLVNKEIGIK